jgi:hypothetical protein
MRAQAKLAVLIGLAGLGSGCVNDAYRRADGITVGAGDKVAGNSVMQMVDPWQDGVQDTRLLVPASRGTATAGAAGDAADAKQSQTMSGNSDN